jgi:hypothetical protein
MAGTSRMDLVRGKERFGLSENKGRAIAECPKVSKAISVVATAGTPIQAVVVPAGAYVYRVGVYCVAAVTSGDGFSLGDGGGTNRYIHAVTAMRIGDIMYGGQAGAVSGDHVHGHYYSTEDTIDVTLYGTATTGTIKVLVWYTFLT